MCHVRNPERILVRDLLSGQGDARGDEAAYVPAQIHLFVSIRRKERAEARLPIPSCTPEVTMGISRKRMLPTRSKTGPNCAHSASIGKEGAGSDLRYTTQDTTYQEHCLVLRKSVDGYNQSAARSPWA